jgi:hypothetical protein
MLAVEEEQHEPADQVPALLIRERALGRRAFA